VKRAGLTRREPPTPSAGDDPPLFVVMTAVRG
jgi:hypothetical protein